MPHGLECYDDSGEITLSITDRLTRILDIITIPLETGYTYTYTNAAFIEHEPFIHFPVFNELDNVSVTYPNISYANDTTSFYGWNSKVNASYFQLIYERLSPDTIKISTKFFYGIANGNVQRYIEVYPRLLKQIPVKVIIGVY